MSAPAEPVREQETASGSLRDRFEPVVSATRAAEHGDTTQVRDEGNEGGAEQTRGEQDDTHEGPRRVEVRYEGTNY